MRKLFRSILWAALLTLMVFGVASAQEERYDNVYLLRFTENPHHILIQVRCDVPSTPITIYFGDGSAEQTMDCIPDFGEAHQYYPFAEHFYSNNGLVINYPIKIQVGAETHYLVVEVGAPVTEDVPFIAWYSVPDATTLNRVFLRSNMCHLLPHEDGAFPNVPVSFGDGSSTVSPCSSLSSGSKTEHWYPQDGEPDMFVATVGGVGVEVYDGETVLTNPIQPLTVTVTLDEGFVNSGHVNISNCLPESWHNIKFGDGDTTDSKCNMEGNTSVLHDWPYNGQAITYTITVDEIYTRTLALPENLEQPNPDPTDGFALEVTQDPELFNRYWFNISGAEEYGYIHITFGNGSDQTDALIENGVADVPYDYPIIENETREYFWSAGPIGENPHYMGIITIVHESPEPPIQQPVKIEVNQVGMSNHVEFLITECVVGMYYPLVFGDASQTDALCVDGVTLVPHDYPWSLEIKEYPWYLGIPDAILASGVVHVGELDEAVFLPLVTN